LLTKIIFLAKKKKPSRERGGQREREEAEKNGEARKHVKQLLRKTATIATTAEENERGRGLLQSEIRKGHERRKEVS
jgi:hypothetical protein